MHLSLRLPRLPSILESYTCRVFLIFLIPYALLVYLARLASWHDPTSLFFRENAAYEASYSTVRAAQGTALIEEANNVTGALRVKASPNPTLCVGFASVAREGVSYFESAVGSVLAGLSPVERADLFLILFIAHTEPMQHPAYSEPWLHELADQVLLYDKKGIDIDHIRGLETAEAKTLALEKGLLDYTYLLKACAATGAPYTVMLEDDVVALDGWYHRTKQALRAAERQTEDKKSSKWLYLRLFYTENLLGWNSEEWPTYLLCSLLVASTVLLATLSVRRWRLSSKRFLPNETVFLLCCVCTPLLISLFFATGRVTLRPTPEGVHEMPKFGCCSQGLVFPQGRIMDLAAWYESKGIGYVDMLTEDYANQNGEIRWALTPSVLQHVGSKSSKTSSPIPRKGHRTLTQTLWNFAFEKNDVDTLRQEHEQQLRWGESL
ncbi:integral membrane protein [Aspergillus bertholletiae]|uniref:Integral membrane protein n=1 Tax=Aspergillus bertholletiae TaxID=1226010 RepID=A0A5N7BBD5_9EURO|nr:integral membrane protein [Aspergillus bertholletiae]